MITAEELFTSNEKKVRVAASPESSGRWLIQLQFLARHTSGLSSESCEPH
jgi:hypothetical protein